MFRREHRIGDWSSVLAVPTENFIPADTPYGSAVDGQYICWGNFGTNTIGRANLDGTGANERFITGACNFPTRVAVDSQHIYWTTWTMGAVPSTGTIGEANLDGTRSSECCSAGKQ